MFRKFYEIQCNQQVKFVQFRAEQMIESNGKTLHKEQETLRELHMKSQQFKQALTAHANQQ